ncbi:hypothetical protein [Haloarcula halobia]|uniref:hypothetical protein n=1 Tax=Haloarcula halobia TaxID=3033388 RepID=UPI0023EBC0AF|nr:hypothetical protein [Halomicroarcula sp. XH51]
MIEEAFKYTVEPEDTPTARSAWNAIQVVGSSRPIPSVSLWIERGRSAARKI